VDTCIGVEAVRLTRKLLKIAAIPDRTLHADYTPDFENPSICFPTAVPDRFVDLCKMAMVHCSCDFASKQALRRPVYAAAALTQSKARFSGKTAGLAQKPIGAGPRPSRSAVVEVLDFKFLKNLGLKKPEFLPDFGKVGKLSAHNRLPVPG